MDDLTPAFKLKLSALPASPGIYKFLDAKGGILYIGKAKNLRARVRQYFAGEDERPQIPYLLKEAADLDYTLVSNELESLYLERTLIQKHKPKYNIDLRDDKAYAFIVIDYSTEIPQIVIQRKISPPSPQGRGKDKVKGAYFGPFTAAYKIRDLIFLARKTFGLCSAQKPGKPCFYYHLHRCPGVCAGVMNLEEYRQHLNKIKVFFSGRIAPVIKLIGTEMQKAAREKKFEKAASLRDQLRALNMLEEKQNVIMPKPVDWDIVGLAVDEGIACVNLFKIRAGKLMDKENFIYSLPNIVDGRQLCQQNFLEDYYSQTSDAPKEIILSFGAANAELIKKVVKDRFKKSVKIVAPKRGKTLSLLKLSRANAEEYLKNYLNEKAGHLDKVQRGLNQLKEVLKLNNAPKRIECYDISNTQGTNAVGSMVVFEHGLPKKSEYRKFKIRTKDTPDDFAMMKEMLSRRLNRIKNQESRIMNENTWPLPDLIVIDGGKGQLSAAVSILNATGYPLKAIPTIGLAKRIEEIFLPDQPDPIILSHDQPALQLLQRLRDEAHRFGITYHRSLRSKEAIKSALDNIPGLGPKTKKLLKAKFGTVANIRNQPLEALKEAVGEKLAKKIKNEL